MSRNGKPVDMYVSYATVFPRDVSAVFFLLLCFFIFFVDDSIAQKLAANIYVHCLNPVRLSLYLQ